MNRLCKKSGYSLVEVMVVILIIMILASIATPAYSQHVRRARVTEAVATMTMIQQALRDYRINHNGYFDIAQLDNTGNIQKALPTSFDTGNGTPTPNPSGVEVTAGTAQFFSNSSYSVDAVNHSSARFTGPGPIDFVIRADGSKSRACSGTETNCAINNAAVSNYRLEMDNTGRVFISYDGGTNWSAL